MRDDIGPGGNAPVGVLRGVGLLALGTASSRVLLAASQLLLAFWLTPEDFGYWATASAVTALTIGLRNLGQVNGFLSIPGADVKDYLASAWPANAVLAAATVAIAIPFALSGQVLTASLIVILSVALPFQGESDLLYAGLVRADEPARIALGLVLGATVKLAVAVAIAWTLRSPLAFAISYLAAQLVTGSALRRALLDRWWPIVARSTGAPRVRFERAWSVNALVVFGYTQVDYLVIAWVATPQILGLYFFSYQATVGLTGLVAVPLSRTMLSQLARSPVEVRRELARSTARHVASLSIPMSAFCALAVTLAAPSLQGQWRPAAPLVVALLGSVAARLLTPIVDSSLHAAGLWWTSTRLSSLDALGTALAASSALLGDPVIVAAAVGAWKAAFAILKSVRASQILGGGGLVVPGVVLVAVAVSAGLLIVSAFVGGQSAIGLQIAGALCALPLMARGRRHG